MARYSISKNKRVVLTETKSKQDEALSKEKSKYCRYLKSAEDSLKKALLVDNYTNRSFTLTTKISKSAKYRI